MTHPASSTWQQKWIALDCYCPELQALSLTAEVFCRRWFANSPRLKMLVMAGESGCGKTHVARAIYRYCRAAALRAYTDGAGKTWRGGSLPSATFARWPEVAAEIAAGHTGLIEELREADLAVLDDIGAENDPWKKAADALCQLLSRREFRFSVVTTNIKLEEWSSRFDTRTADRLLRNSEVINLFGVKSYAMI